LALELVGPHLDLISSPSPLVCFFFSLLSNFPFVSAETHPSNHPAAPGLNPLGHTNIEKNLMPSSTELTVVHQGQCRADYQKPFFLFLSHFFPPGTSPQTAIGPSEGGNHAPCLPQGQISDHTAEFGTLRIALSYTSVTSKRGRDSNPNETPALLSLVVAVPFFAGVDVTVMQPRQPNVHGGTLREGHCGQKQKKKTRFQPTCLKDRTIST
jgi:hypothetical protein